MIKILPNGGTMYRPSPTSKTIPKRSECKGWNRATSRRNTDFLLSVKSDELTGYGYALSLTIKNCPETPQHWNAIRRRFVERLRYNGMIRMHWLTEWQRRQVPHLHAAVWFSKETFPDEIIYHWVLATQDPDTRVRSQNVQPITGAAGWFEYLAKHAARGVAHYQRSSDLIPPNWKGNTGRLWGKVGDWPVAESKLVDAIPLQVEHQYRRLMIRYQIAKARRQRDRGRIKYLRRYLSKAPKETSRSANLPRLWIPEDDQWSLLACAMASHSPDHL